MASSWQDVIADPEYIALPEEEKSEIRKRYWNNVVLKDPDTQRLDVGGIAKLEEQFFGTPKKENLLSKVKKFAYDAPKEGAATIRDWAAGSISPTEQEIVDTATRTGDVPETKILLNMAARGAAEIVPMTPSEIAATVFGAKALSAGAPKLAGIMKNNFPRLWGVLQRNVGRGLFAKIPPPPAAVPTIEAPAVLAKETSAIVSAAPAQAGEDVFGQQLSKFNVSDDAKGIFKETSEIFKGRIDEARRGVQDWGETERLADQLGMSVKDLTRRRAGQAFNAEELEAAKGLVGRSLMDVNAARTAYAANPSDEALVQLNKAIAKHAVVQGSFLGARAEAGRALQILRKVTDPAQGNIEKVIEMLGGRELTKEIAGKLATIDPSDIPALNKFIRDSMKAKTSDQLYFVWINSILSSPWTHARNTIGNSMLALSKPVEKVFRGGIDALAGTVTGKRTAYAAEAVPEAYGLARGLGDGLRKGLYTLWHGIRPSISKVEDIKISPIPGVAGRAVGAPVTILEATDEVFKAMVAQSELSALAYRSARSEGLKGARLARRVAEIEANPSPDILEKVTKESLIRTYQNKPSEAFAGILRSFQRFPYVGRFIVPFIKTPVNIAGQSAMRSPLGWLKVAHSIANKKGQEQVVDEAAKAAMGSLIAAGVAYHAANGNITGAPPKDPAERDQWYRTGKRPYSAKIAGYWVPYTIGEPWAAGIGMVADSVQNAKREAKDVDPSIATAVIATFPRYFVSKTFMSGIRDFMDALSDGERFGPKLLMRQASGMVPYSGFMRYIQSTYDQTMKDPQTVGQAVKSVIPGLADSVPRRLDVYGNVMKYPGFDESVLQGVASLAAVPMSAAIDDPLVSEDVELDRMTGYPSRSLAGVPLSDDEYRDFLRRSGQLYQTVRRDLQSLDGWKSMDAAARNSVLSEFQEKARMEARLNIYWRVLDRLPDGEARQDLIRYGVRTFRIPPDQLLARKPRKK